MTANTIRSRVRVVKALVRILEEHPDGDRYEGRPYTFDQGPYGPQWKEGYSLYYYATGKWATHQALPEHLKEKYLVLRMAEVGDSISGVGERTSLTTFDVEV